MVSSLWLSVACGLVACISLVVSSGDVCEDGRTECQLTSIGSEEGSLLQLSRGPKGATSCGQVLPYSHGKCINSTADIVVKLTVSLGNFEPYTEERLSIFVNKTFAAPTIRATEGDLVEVQITNSFFSQGTTMHWHGMWQNGTNEMDGVDGVTQCSFPPGTTFTYRFVAYPAGTHWYHSHDGVQYADGLSGPLIVMPKSPPESSSSEEAEEEILVFLSDWSNDYAPQELAATLEGMDMTSMESGEEPNWGDTSDVKWYGVLARQPDGRASEPLIRMGADSASGAGNGAPTLAEKLTTLSGAARLRIVCATSNQMFVVTLPGVNFTVIAIDGEPIEPYGPVTRVVMSAGDRIDVRLPAGAAVNPTTPLVVSSVDGEDGAIVTDQEFSMTLLESAEPSLIPAWSKAGLCDSSADTFDDTCLSLMYSRGLRGVEAPPSGPPQKQFNMTLGGAMNPYGWAINNITFEFPYPSLFASEGMSAKKVIPGPGKFDTGTQILEAAVGDVVDFKIVNPTGMYHPFHLHGHAFWVLGAGNGTIPDEAPQPAMPVRKDNQNIPAGQPDIGQSGWAWLRFVADSPGWWIFHCHIDFHLATGMDLVLKVGSSSEINDWNEVPPSFMECVKRMDGGAPATAARKTSGMSGMPGMSDMPGMSGMPGTSGMPGMSGMPMSTTPGMSGMPGTSTTPGMSGMPGMR
jgi:iron transport multicopper oxidase